LVSSAGLNCSTGDRRTGTSCWASSTR
jgi:hypothetical protein